MESKRTNLFVVLCALALTVTVVSNITAGKPLALPFGLAATAGIVTMPVGYIVNDVLAEVYGWRRARFCVVLSYAMNLLAVAAFLATIALPGSSAFSNQLAFEAVLGTTPRLLVASACGFLAGSLSNAKIMDVMHVRDGESKLALRCILSTLVGEVIDKLLFVTVAFAGVLPWSLILTMIVTQSLIGCAYETIIYPLATRHVIRWAKSL